MILMRNATDNDIVNNLRTRYINNSIYTYISDVLISVNPYEPIHGLYSHEQVEIFKNRYFNEVPPHLYAIAEKAYRNLQKHLKSQCIIISGESGSGKTEACKEILKYISIVSGNDDDVLRVKNIISESNPLLEAFGNAKTVRNDNSSRFGKYFEIKFDSIGKPLGGEITIYLLEKSRLCNVPKGERSFHIFYQMIKGIDPKIKEALGILNVEEYHFLNHSKCDSIEGVNDAERFQTTVRAMSAMGIDQENQLRIFKYLSAILLLGNLQFSENGTSTKVINRKQLLKCATLLNIDETILEGAITKRIITVEGKTIETLHNSIQAKNTRDALSKLIYERVFQYILNNVNAAMQCSDFDLTIDILDIYGFEVLESNSFEQLIINYVNEKLQNIFSDMVIKSEIDEYDSEGIPYSTTSYVSNKHICDLIDGSNPPGIMALLDSICAYSSAEDSYEADKKFLESLSTINNKNFSKRSNNFIVEHYAGPVSYNGYSFTEKNKDSLSKDVISCMQTTNDTLLYSFFPDDSESKKRVSRIPTASAKIRKSIDDLIQSISIRETHYIRCIKPNELKQPKQFDLKKTLHQVKYLGLLENVKLRRNGYCYRDTFDVFFNKYRVLFRNTLDWSGSIEQGALTILTDCNIPPSEYYIGKTKIFLKSPASVAILDELMDRYYHGKATVIARAFRRYQFRKYLQGLKSKALDVLGDKKQRRRNSICREYRGDYLDFFNNAQLLEIMQPYKNEGGVFFADHFKRPKAKLFKTEPTMSRLQCILTQKAIYFIARTKVKERFCLSIYKRIAFAQIDCIILSNLPDNWMCIKILDDCAIFCQNEHKVEFLTILEDLYKKEIGELHIVFSNDYEYEYKKKKFKKVEFITDYTNRHREAIIQSTKTFNFQITVSRGLLHEQVCEIAKKSFSKLTRSQTSSKSSFGLALGSLESCPKLPIVVEPIAHALPPPLPKTKPVVVEYLEEPVKVPEVAQLPPPTIVESIEANQNEEVCESQPTRLLVLYDYNAALEDELSLRDGDVVHLKKINSDGWGYGEIIGAENEIGDRKRIGFFPLNYCVDENSFLNFYSNPETLQ